MSIETAKTSAEKFSAATPVRQTIDQYAMELEKHGHITPAVQEALDKARNVRSGHAIVFYIAGGLTGMSEEVKERYAQLSSLIETMSKPEATMFGYAPHLYGTDPKRHPDVTPAEVRTIDYLWAGVVADGHFNFWHPVAHGNAIEAAWAEMHGIPSMHIVSEGMTTSRLVRGLRNIVGTLVYTDFQRDGLPQAQEFLHQLQDHYTIANV